MLIGLVSWVGEKD